MRATRLAACCSICSVFARDTSFTTRPREIANQFSTPEEIDDGKATAPSKRILKLAPEYEKVAHGVTVAARIPLSAIRLACPNFDAWIRRLEALAVVPAAGSESP